MDTVCPTEGHCMAYPDVLENATRWVWSDEKPPQETVTVTAHGLRRLLRLASQCQRFALAAAVSDEKVFPAPSGKELAAILNETSSVWCEGDLVMSRLFVTADGKAIAHCDEEVDAASVPPWEKPAAAPAGEGELDQQACNDALALDSILRNEE